jgi:hypothetical protein
LDTRTKILPWPDAVARIEAGDGVAVAGHFDPLVAAHAARLRRLAEEHGRPLIVVITDPPDPLLPAQARAELAAGLDAAGLVTIAPDGADSFLGLHAVDLRTADRETTATLIRHVHRRQAPADG